MIGQNLIVIISQVHPLVQLLNGLKQQQLFLMKVQLLVREIIWWKKGIHEFYSLEIIQYRVLYDYTPERPDEMAISSGDIITVSSSIPFSQ